jgi:hypothetical protein
VGICHDAFIFIVPELRVPLPPFIVLCATYSKTPFLWVPLLFRNPVTVPVKFLIASSFTPPEIKVDIILTAEAMRKHRAGLRVFYHDHPE